MHTQFFAYFILVKIWNFASLFEVFKHVFGVVKSAGRVVGGLAFGKRRHRLPTWRSYFQFRLISRAFGMFRLFFQFKFLRPIAFPGKNIVFVILIWQQIYQVFLRRITELLQFQLNVGRICLKMPVFLGILRYSVDRLDIQFLPVELRVWPYFLHIRLYFWPIQNLPRSRPHFGLFCHHVFNYIFQGFREGNGYPRQNLVSLLLGYLLYSVTIIR